MPAVAVGKVAGWTAASLVLFAWTALGLGLVFAVGLRMTGVEEMLRWAWLVALLLVLVDF